MIKEVLKGPGRATAYLDDIIVDAPGPTAHTANIRAPFQRLRFYNPKLSAAKEMIGATKTDSLALRRPPPALAEAPTRSLP